MMRKITDILLNIILTVFSGICYILTINGRMIFGKFLGILLRLILPSRIDVTLDNLKNAFPEASQDWINDIMKKSFTNLGIVLAEILSFPLISDDKIRKYIKYENLNIYNDAYSKGKGVIVLSAHFGNWELLAYTCGLYSGLPMLVVVENQKNDFIRKNINKFRTRGGNRVVSRYNAARDIVRELRNGGTVGLLADQSATKDKDIFVDFFGRKAATYEAPANLALKFGIPILCAFPVRQPDGTYLAKCYNIDDADLEYNKAGIEELTKRHVKTLENAIREHPELWVWQHKRWKHQPN